MVGIAGGIYIDRPPAVVFDFVADERNEPKFNWRMTAVTLGVGRGWHPRARYTATMTSRSRPVTMTLEWHRVLTGPAGSPRSPRPAARRSPARSPSTRNAQAPG